MARRLAALAALLLILVVPPILLTWVGAYDWRGLSLWTPTDVRLLLLVLTAVGWLAWLAWLVSVLMEVAAVLSRGRLRVRLPLLAPGQAIAASLLAALLASTPTLASASPAPTPVTAVAAADPGAPAGPDVTAEATVADAASPPQLAHTVGVGDDLWTLAERYYGEGTRWRDIVAANPEALADPLVELPVGSVLRVAGPVRLVTVVAGDTLWDLAERHLGDADRWPELRALNAALIEDPDVIRPGWVLRVPLVSDARPGDAPATPVVAPLPALTEPAPTPDAPPPPAAVPALTTSDAPVDVTTLPVDQGEPDADPAEVAEVVALAGGLSALTAATALTGLAVRRRVLDAVRPRGRRYVQPGDDLRRVESALAVRAWGTGATDPAHCDRTLLVGRAMRHLSACWLEADLPAPDLVEVVAGPVDVEFVFATGQPVAPDGFQRLGTRVAASWSRLAALEEPSHPLSHPALVTLGTDAAGQVHLVDLLAAGVVGVWGEASAGEALSAWVLELASSPWASEAGLLVVTENPAFLRSVGLATVAATASVAEGVRVLESLAEERGRFLTAPDAYARARLDPNLAEAWSPQVVVFETVPDADALARVQAAVTRNMCGLAAVLPVPAGAGGVSWRVSDAVGTLFGGPARPLGPFTVPALPTSTREALASLYDRAQSDTTEPAPWWASDEHPEEPHDVNIIALRPVPAVTGPLLRLLGPVVLEGAAGEEAPRASRQCLEYCAWLLEHPGATALQMASELLVAEGTRRSNMSRLRSWLGAAPDGGLYLPDAYSGRIHLHDDVTSDWAQLREVLFGGVNRASTERLTAALELVRGAPLADAAPGQWHWAEELRSDMVALVRDAGLVLSARARAEHHLDLARWAANRALVAAPDDELLLGERLRTAYAAGELDEVARLANRLHRTARTLGTDLLPETVDLLQEVMEGRLRARRA